MNKANRLYKLQNGTQTAVWAHDEIVNQDKRIAELENELSHAETMGEKAQAIRDLEQKALGCFECCNEGGEDKQATYMFLREINNFGVNYSKQAKKLREQATGGVE